MTFQDLRSGCCSTNSHTGNRKDRENLPVAANLLLRNEFFDGTSHLHRFFISFLKSQHKLALASLLQESNAMKASVPKLFNCPGATTVPHSLSGDRLVGHRGLSRPLEELTTPWDRSRLVS